MIWPPGASAPTRARTVLNAPFPPSLLRAPRSPCPLAAAARVAWCNCTAPTATACPAGWRCTAATPATAMASSTWWWCTHSSQLRWVCICVCGGGGCWAVGGKVWWWVHPLRPAEVHGSKGRVRGGRFACVPSRLPTRLPVVVHASSDPPHPHPLGCAQPPACRLGSGAS